MGRWKELYDIDNKSDFGSGMKIITFLKSLKIEEKLKYARNVSLYMKLTRLVQN